MTIEIAEDNHIGIECKKLSKPEVSGRHFQIYEDWKEEVENGSYQDYDCDGAWACEFEGDKYRSAWVVSSEDAYSSKNKPIWATHVLWSSK